MNYSFVLWNREAEEVCTAKVREGIYKHVTCYILNSRRRFKLFDFGSLVH